MFRTYDPLVTVCACSVSKVNQEIPGRFVKNLRNDGMSCECDIGCSLPLGTNHFLLSSLSVSEACFICVQYFAPSSSYHLQLTSKMPRQPSVFQQQNGEPESRVNTGACTGFITVDDGT